MSASARFVLCTVVGEHKATVERLSAQLDAKDSEVARLGKVITEQNKVIDDMQKHVSTWQREQQVHWESCRSKEC